MPQALPLPALLSEPLVAFTMEVDNEFEHRMPHRTTRHGGSADGGPWLASMVMYWNCMRFVGDEPVTTKEVERLARTSTNWDGMRRWGYITIGADHLVRPTSKGRAARDAWPGLIAETEQRWISRFGAAAMARLRESLSALIVRFNTGLPDCLPILHYGLFCRAKPIRDVSDEVAGLALPALLSKPLLAFALLFERDSELSLAISANVLRVIPQEGIRARDLPAVGGVSKEAIAMALNYLVKRGYAAKKPLVTLTNKGVEGRARYHSRIREIEERWKARFGAAAIEAVRDTLNSFRGYRPTPYPDNWRAARPAPEVLPHFPMVLHRGGYPDGA